MLPFLRPRRAPERLATSFRWLERKLLPATRAAFYAAVYERGAYALALEKDSYFAWETLSDDRRFSDFILEATVELDPANGHCAAGVLFRHVDDENFYSFLVSSRGNYRVDLLFNNHPLRLIEWTPLPAPDSEEHEGASPRELMIVARGSRFTFLADGEWIGEVEDETLPAGSAGFAAQNFAGAARGVFRLRRLAIETRPVAVERTHLQWTSYLPVSPVARLRFAETLFTMGSFDAAVVQLRKGLKDREGSLREHFLLGECYARLTLYPEALAEVEEVLALDPRHADARMEKANLLYLANRLQEARDYLVAGLGDGAIVSSGAAWNLAGNAEYGLGNWDAAAEAYRRAVAADPGAALFLRNAARASERAGHAEEAVALYLGAARRLFEEEAFDELSLVMPRVRELAPRNPEVLAIEAKMLYREGRTDEAFAVLSGLEEAGTDDSAVHYLLGLILSARGSREEALRRFERAATLAPEFALYHFRLAETLHLLGRDAASPLARALALAPEDPWANNLAGQLHMHSGDPAAAVEALERARAASPTEEDISLNLSEALSLCGRHEEALRAVDDYARAAGDSARAANQRGNVLARQGERAAAVREYETAIRMDPENVSYKENCAAACVEIDMVHRAEELLAQVEPEHPSPSVYNLLGQVAALKGERARAESAFTRGLEMAPGDPDLTVNLALLLRERGQHERARDTLIGLLAATPGHARAAAVLRRIRDEREQRLACARCGREWWAPRELPPQPAIRVRGEPAPDAPAGRCPKCGKIYCVGCASAYLKEMRFFCPDCGESLKISDDALKWLLIRSVERSGAAEG